MLKQANHNNSMVLNVMELVQKNEVFYIGKIKVRDLINISTVHTRKMTESGDLKYLKEVKEIIDSRINIVDSEKGIQRALQIKRLKEIAKYVREENGILPGSLILSINNKFNWDSDDEFRVYEDDGFKLNNSKIKDIYELTIYPNMVDTFIVDGQHRLASFIYATDIIDKFEIPITIFLDLKIPMQAELFSNINGNQKPVKKSLLYDLTEFKESEYSIIKKCHSIAKLFGSNANSPFYNKIDMLGNKNGVLSQAAFIDELIRYVKHRKFNNYKSFLQYKTDKEIVDILYTYFSAIKYVYNTEWDNTKEYFILRTTGFGTLMKLMYYIYIHLYYEKKEFNKKELINIFKKVHTIEKFSVESIGKVGSQGIQKQLCDKIVKNIIGDEAYISLIEKNFKNTWDEKLK